MSKNIKNISGRIGITGGTGVLGSILTKKLKKNYTVINFDHDIQNISKVKKWVKKNKEIMVKIDELKEYLENINSDNKYVLKN